MTEKNIIELKKLSKSELYAALEVFINKANFDIVEFLDSKKERKYLLSKNNKPLSITVLIKNICDCGWKHRKNIKRIQILKMQRPPKTTKDACFLLLGLTSVNGKHILVAWNPLKYIYHEKNRSAYVYDDALFRANKMGFYQTVQNGEKLLICNEYNFNELLEKYYAYSYVEEI